MIRCPICKAEVAPGAADFPFCSERCRLIDLGNWASGKYVIPTPAKPGELLQKDDDEAEGE
jgi:hypothetical protein